MSKATTKKDPFACCPNCKTARSMKVDGESKNPVTHTVIEFYVCSKCGMKLMSFRRTTDAEQRKAELEADRERQRIAAEAEANVAKVAQAAADYERERAEIIMQQRRSRRA